MPFFTRAFLLLIAFHIMQPKASAEIADTEQKFHDLFVTAGYSTAFGAALGAAALGLSENPADKLSYIATGASLGFIGGSIFGTYLAFSPVFADESSNSDINALVTNDYQQPFQFTIGPVVGSKSMGAFGKLSLSF